MKNLSRSCCFFCLKSKVSPKPFFSFVFFSFALFQPLSTSATALRAHLVIPAPKKKIPNSDQASPNDWNYLWGGGEVVFIFFLFLQSLLAWLPSIKKSVNLFFFCKSQPKASQSTLHNQEKSNRTLESKLGVARKNFYVRSVRV